MKIKTWLLLTYLLVMLIPLGALYGLYVSINAYYQDKNVEEYFDKWAQITGLKEQLNNPALYARQADFQDIEALGSEQLMITLYGANGRVFYTTNPLIYTNYEAKNVLYKNLYELKQNYETFVYKEPVYEDGAIKGIYKITLLRTEWVKEVRSKTIGVVAGLGVILLFLYALVIYLLNRRLNRPAKRLIEQMQLFAKGEPTKQLPEAKDELGELTKSFQSMQCEIVATREKLNEEQRQKEFMIASLSHDLKTPLTSIQAYTESLLAGKLTNEQRDYLQVIYTKSDYMKQLLEDLMMYTLLQSHAYELALVDVNGEEFFDMLLADYEQISKEKGFEATTTIAVARNYRVHPKQLMRVVDNLLANAWHYTNAGGTITVAAFEHDAIPVHMQHFKQHFTREGLYIVVENSGSPLTPEQCIQMFEPLQQLDASRSSVGYRGTGLGLTIAKQIIEKHYGMIQAVSNETTAIIIWLPFIRSD